MAEPGLTSRLRQHSRRSGMMVGLSMALSIAIVIVAFIWIYVRLSPFVSDFVPSDNPASASLKGGVASPVAQATAATQVPSATRAAGTGALVLGSPTPSPSPTVVWQATHTIRPDRPDINFRAGPSTLADVVTVLRPGTELKFLGEQQQASGVTWMKFETKDGKVGWVRNVDVVTTSGASP